VLRELKNTVDLPRGIFFDKFGAICAR
jgi:hypothetical protein